MSGDEAAVAAFIDAALRGDEDVAGPEHPMFGPVIARTGTRRQLLEDGDLLDITESARAVGIMLPVAITRGVYADCVAWSDEDNARKGTVQDMPGRLHDLVWMLRAAMLAGPNTSDPQERLMRLLRVPRPGRGCRPRLVTLRAVISGGDVGEPVLTVLLPGED